MASDLFNFHARGYPSYPDGFIHPLLDQYKLCVTAADNASSRRESSNRYLMTLNTAILALQGLQTTSGGNLYLLAIFAITGLVVAGLSLLIVGSFKKLNEAKFKVILEMESYLPAAAFGYEWRLLDKPDRGRVYQKVTDLEWSIYWVFGGLHLLMFMVVAVVLPSVGMTDWASFTSTG